MQVNRFARTILGLAVVSLILAVSKVARRGWQQLLEPECVLWVWTLYYLVFLVWRVRIRSHRALLPIVPFLLILAAHTAGQFAQWIRSRLPRRFSSMSAGAMTFPLSTIPVSKKGSWCLSGRILILAAYRRPSTEAAWGSFDSRPGRGSLGFCLLPRARNRPQVATAVSPMMCVKTHFRVAPPVP